MARPIIPRDVMEYVLGAHGGHGGGAPGAPAPVRSGPVKMGPADTEAFGAALAGDREGRESAVLAQNLSRAAALYRGEQVGSPAVAVPDNVRDFILRRQLAGEDAAARAAKEPAPSEWGAPGLTRPEALAQGWAKKPEHKEPDPLAELKGRKLKAEVEKLEGGGEPKTRPTKAQIARGSALGIHPAEGEDSQHFEAAIRSAGQRDRSLDIAEDNAKARREAADAKRRMVSDAQVKAISDYDRGIRILEDVIREKPEIDTGPAANAQNWVAQRLGVDDPQVSSYKSQVNDFLAQYIRSISGAATTDKERAFLLQNMPKLSDADDVFKAKADRTIKRLRELRAVEVDLIRRQGKDTAQFEDAPVMDRGEGMPAPPNAKRPRRTVDGETREWDGKAWVPVGA